MPRNIVGPRGVKRDISGGMPNLVYNGGPLLANVEVTTIYWGSAWASDPLRDQLDQFFDFIVTSTLIDQLGEYSQGPFTIGHGSHVASLLVSQDPPASVDDIQIQAFVQQMIAGGMVPAQGPNSLYFVFTPSGVTVTFQGQQSCVDFCGYHSTPDGALFYAVVPYADCLGCQFEAALLDSMTVIASHELCEGITDPAVGSGWVDPNTGFEIGDICEGSDKMISEGAVQAGATGVQTSAAPTFDVSVSPTTVAIDGTVPVSLMVTLTPSVAPPPPPPPPPPTMQWIVQTEWSNAQGACV